MTKRAKKYALPARNDIDAEIIEITAMLFALAVKLDKLGEKLAERERNRFRPCD